VLQTPSAWSRTQPGCSKSATGSGPTRSTHCSTSGSTILPSPIDDADRAAGYAYQISVLQAEFSLTPEARPARRGGLFFEQVIRDNLGIGRPDHVSLVFDRRLVRRGSHPTPWRFRTRVITAGDTPRL